MYYETNSQPYGASYCAHGDKAVYFKTKMYGSCNVYTFHRLSQFIRVLYVLDGAQKTVDIWRRLYFCAEC